MIRSGLRAITIGLLLLAAPAVARAQAPSFASLGAQEQGASAIPGASETQPAVWVVRDEDTTIYLFGTLHVRREGARWGGPVAEWALEQAGLVWTETDIPAAGDASIAALVRSLGYEASKPLSRNRDINRVNKDRLRRAAEKTGIAYADLDNMRPWLASVTLAMAPLLRAGYNPDHGVDRAVVEIARKSRKTLKAFETSKDQFGFFAGLSAPLQLELLYQSLDELDKDPQSLRQLEFDWERGNDAALRENLVDEVRNSNTELYNVLLKDRNSDWANQIDRQLKDAPGVQFVAVGVAHLVGDESVLHELDNMGYTVTRLTPCAPGAQACK